MKEVTNLNPVRGFHKIDYIKITIFGFGLAALWGSLHSIVLPLRLLDFVIEAEKNTYLGILTFTGLMLAIVIQPIIGAVSDRSSFSLGRRRPYIMVGALATIIFLLGLGLVEFLPGLELVGGYVALFVIYCFLQISANTAQGPYQAFIPDLVPEQKRGLASGVKSLLEIGGGVALLYPIAFLMDRYFASQEATWLWLALGALALVLLGVTLATLLTVREQPGIGSQLPLLPTLYKSFKIEIRANPNFVKFLISRLLVFMAFTTLQTFALYFLKDVVGVANPATATFQFSIVAVACMLVVVYPAGRLSDKIGRRPIATASAILGAFSIALIYLFQQNYTLIILCGGFVGISFGAFMSSNWALATDLVGKGEEARYLGLTNLATAGGAALARLIGPVIDFFNAYSPILGYQVMLLACFIYFLIGSALLIKIKGRGLAEIA